MIFLVHGVILHFPTPFSRSSVSLPRVEISLGPDHFLSAKQKQPAVCVVLRPHSEDCPSVPKVKGRSLRVLLVSTGMPPLKGPERK